MLRGFLWLCDLLRPHDSALAVPRPHDGIPHSSPRSPPKTRADHERTQTPDSPNDLFSTPCCAPQSRRSATEYPSLWPRTAASVTSSAMTRLPRACHAPQWPRLFSWHGRVASCDTTVPDFTWHGVSRHGASADIRPPLHRSADLGECLPERGRSQHRSPFASVATPTFSVWL